ncbi:MAG: hypothetical protein QGD94_03410, partial [Planctomycetia bacterium]|nr:hypothetical protein [Planctomycetia bacterium]
MAKSSKRPPKKARKKAAAKPEKEVGHVVSHVHWDREWRWPIWETRMLLMTAMGLLIDTMEKNPKYRHFVFDGQTVGIEDYLEFKPEDLPRIKKLGKAGRLLIGPWYTLPEQSPIDGESLVRNLVIGHRLSAKYGKTMKVGYTTFGWGQPAQMPQLYAGFGFDVIITGKHIDPARCPESEFLWRSPDGTEVLTTKLGIERRQNFYFMATIPIGHGKPGLTPEYKFDWTDAGLLFHRADETGLYNEYERGETTIHEPGLDELLARSQPYVPRRPG